LAARHSGVNEDEEIPQTLRDGRYRLLGVIGEGAQAHTFDALDTTTNTRLAIKRFRVRGARSWKDVELAEREARVLSELNHPNLPKYIEHFEEGGALFLAMEKVEGQTLAELRRDGGSIGARELVRFLDDAAQILAYLHGRAPSVIHRDIKPQNVIRRPDGSFALVDFGSVRDRLRPEGGSTVVGTFGYMAPEQFQGRALPATDVYGVGATAIACLTGEEPENLPHKGLALDVRRALGPARDPQLATLLERMLEPDPDRRANDLARALQDVLGDRRERGRGERTAPRTGRTGPPPNAWGPPRSNPALGPLLVLIITLMLFVARVATFGLFRLALPLALGILAWFFGGALRDAARRCLEIGQAGELGLRNAARRVRGMGPLPGRRPRRRYRVGTPETIDTEGEAVEDAEDREYDRDQRRARRRY
jgi:tRNA A-37 threonylcarbamoyl transferase component Bud32